MRWDSPMVLVTAGTVAIHLIVVVFVDAMVVTHPLLLPAPAPVIEMVEVDVEPPPPPKVEPPPEPPPVPDLPDPQPLPPQPPVARAPQPQVRAQPQPPQETPPDPTPGPPGGDTPSIPLGDPPPEGRGIAPPVARGKSPGRGRGGSGGGTGTGNGSGAGDPPPAPPPVSVATIKTRALPKGDYGYIDAGKDYPAEARQLGVEGPIRVKLVVDAQGKVQSAVLLNKLGHGLDELALTRAKAIEFEPAKDTDDKAVASVVVWTFNMTLPK